MTYNIQPTKYDIVVQFDDNELERVYLVRFYDENGSSILAKTKNNKLAMKYRNKFRKDLERGILLRPYKSAYKEY